MSATVEPVAGSAGEAVAAFAGIMHRLRAECAWNAVQTHASIVRYAVEEAHELVDAVEAGDDAELAEELGDLLYSVVFHAELAAERGAFDLAEVAERAGEKMVRRHPHVFAGVPAATPEQVEAVWEAVKAEEKAHRRSALDGLPMSLPALLLAEKLLGRAAGAGVVPAAAAPVGLGVPAAPVGPGAPVAPLRPPADEAELGEALLGLVAAARAAGLDPERALRARLRSLAAEVRAAEVLAAESSR